MTWNDEKERCSQKNFYLLYLGAGSPRGVAKLNRLIAGLGAATANRAQHLRERGCSAEQQVPPINPSALEDWRVASGENPSRA